MKKVTVKVSRFGVLATLLFVNCASKPEFRPSHPIEEASSIQQGIALCAEYTPPVAMSRPIMLKPYLDCIRELEERFGASATSAFPVFHRELASRYRSLSETSWTPRLGRELEIGIKAVLRALWSEGADESQRFTRLERELVVLHFPSTAKALGSEDWTTAESVILDPPLENLKAKLASLKQERGVPIKNVPLETIEGFCQELAQVSKDVSHVQDLWTDLTEISRLESEGGLREKIETRYRAQLAGAHERLDRLQKEILASNGGRMLDLSVCGKKRE